MIAELLHWLATPISGASDHAIAMPLAWHGRLMVLALGLLTPPLIISEAQIGEIFDKVGRVIKAVM